MIKEVTKEMREKLRAPLPSEAIKPHPTKTYLSSIKAIYVVERLNDVFGIGAFNLYLNEVERADKGTVVTKLTLTIPAFGIHLESYGGNDNGGEGSKNFDLGDAYKGSSTDAMTKICSYLEIGIDVFKGKSSPKTEVPNPLKNTPSNPSTPVTKKSWLNPGTQEWTDAVSKMTLGTPIETITTFFLLSKDNRVKLIAESKPQTI
jgi:hypothetical protein